MNFGKYVSNFQAFDIRGQSLKAYKIDENCWKIVGTGKSIHIKYDIDDGWEKFDFEGIRPYRSAESHFDSSVIILNTNSIFGYFRNYSNIPFRIKIARPEKLFAATRLSRVRHTQNEDEYFAGNYRKLVDNPIMYALPDTASIALPNISVDVACYSTTHKKIANELAKYISPLLKNQTE